MVLGIVLILSTLIGIVYGIKNKNITLVIVPAIVLIFLIAIGLCFLKNPY